MKYVSEIIKVFLVFGIPKFPYLQTIPIAVAAVPFFVSNIRQILRNKIIIYQVLLLLTFLFYFLFRILQAAAQTEKIDCLFVFSIAIKLALGYIILPSMAILVKSRSNLLILLFFAQCIFVILSTASTDIFNFLMLFQSPGTVDVFASLNGIRAVGFGIIHNEGGLWIAMLMLVLIEQNPSKILVQTIFISSFVFILMSRSNILLILIACFVYMARNYKYIIIFASLLGFALIYGEAILYYLLKLDIPTLNSGIEPFVNLFEVGEFSTQSSQHLLSTMIILPHDSLSWMFGYGQFFDSPGVFYQHTDVGFLRILLCGGLTGLTLYLALLFSPLFFVKMYQRNIFCKNFKYASIHTSGGFSIHYFIAAFSSILLLNFKGLVPLNWPLLLPYFL